VGPGIGGVLRDAVIPAVLAVLGTMELISLTGAQARAGTDPGPHRRRIDQPGRYRLPSGEYRDGTPLTFPHVPGNDFAGTVSELGAGVTAYQVDDEMRAMAGATRPSLSTGSPAEYAVFEADTPFLAYRPAGLHVEQAAALPTTGLTARALMATAMVQPGETVPVVGATGGVGTAVVPLLAAAKARVIATATTADADVLHGLGPEKTIGYAQAEHPF
jgi:NADPH:quinone reductase-like Zn-dependent oxidoreductase